MLQIFLKESSRSEHVHIRIERPPNITDSVGDEVRERYGLDEVIIVASSEEYSQVCKNIGEAGTEYFEKHVQDGSANSRVWRITCFRMIQR